MSDLNKENLINELLTRGVESLYPSKEEFKKRLLADQPLSIYAGLDPTSESLHLGHLSLLLKLRQFVNLGHQVTILIGDFTAMIGDPTDKKSARQRLSAQTVAHNHKDYKKQISRILNLKKIKFAYNQKWLSKMTMTEVVDLGSEFTVSQLMERDMFQARLKNGDPVYLSELMYPLMQGYDSVALGVEAEVGGNDQTFNMLVGRTMLKRRGKDKYVMALKLLTDSTGRKMGKTEGNMVTLLDSPKEIYGRIMSWPDDFLAIGFELCTDLPMMIIKENLQRPAKDAKMALAKAVVKIYYSELESEEAENDFITKFQKKSLPTDLLTLKVSLGSGLAEVLVRGGVS